VLTVNSVLQAHLANQGDYRGDTPLRTSGSTLQTPPASPAKGRESNRISNAQKGEYANLAGAEPRKEKKKQIRQCPNNCGNEPPPGRITDGTIETGSRIIDQPVWHCFALNRLTYLLDLMCIFLKSSPCPMTTMGTKPTPRNFRSILPHPIIRILRIQRKQWLRFCLSVLMSIQRSLDTAIESPWS
jgi:hypothetical protein